MSDRISEFIDSLGSLQLLPHRYKRYAYAVLLLAMPAAIGFAFALQRMLHLSPKPFWQEWGLTILHFPLTIGLSMLVFSKEKQEDEMVAMIRLKTLVYSTISIVFAVLLFPIMSNVTNMFGGRPWHLSSLGDLAVINLLLFISFLHFRIRMVRERARLSANEE